MPSTGLNSPLCERSGGALSKLRRSRGDLQGMQAATTRLKRSDEKGKRLLPEILWPFALCLN